MKINGSHVEIEKEEFRELLHKWVDKMIDGNCDDGVPVCNNLVNHGKMVIDLDRLISNAFDCTPMFAVNQDPDKYGDMSI